VPLTFIARATPTHPPSTNQSSSSLIVIIVFPPSLRSVQLHVSQKRLENVPQQTWSIRSRFEASYDKRQCQSHKRSSGDRLPARQESRTHPPVESPWNIGKPTHSLLSFLFTTRALSTEPRRALTSLQACKIPACRPWLR